MGNNHTPSKVWDEIISPFPDFNGFLVDVWEYMNSFITHFKMDTVTDPITYQMQDASTHILCRRVCYAYKYATIEYNRYRTDC